LKISPKVGDIIEVGHGEKIDYKKIRANSSEQNQNFKREEADDTNMIKLNVFLKSDALGSGEAIEESLEKLNTDKAKIKMIGKSLGNINEGDVIKAESAKAIVLGFNIKTTAKIESLAREKNVKIKIFNIIYDLIEYTNQELQELIKPEFERVDLGKLKVLAIFRTENNAQVVGGKVLEGIVEQDVMIEVLRNKELITTGNLVNLQSGKQNVKVVNVDEECGLRYEGKPMIEVGDILNFHKKQKING
ncbi:MAG: hypothetical protein NT091_04890, partial [Candidatus Falkowbacteria bacterium]|nr:hypothetical protein [Candidatus Falkowbacteria bacterium]